jgi:LPS export ABC transporter protein LptC
MKLRQFVFVSFCEKKQYYKNLNIAVLLFGATMLVLSCNSKVASDIPPELIRTKKIPSIEATNLQTVFTDSGVVRYFLKTPKLLLFDQEKEPYREFPEGFHIQQFDENKKIISELSANYGKNFIKEQKWIATGNVVMVNSKGDTLRTEELTYLVEKDRIFSDQFVSIKKGDQDLTGTGGFESDSQMKKWSFKKVKGPIYFEDK